MPIEIKELHIKIKVNASGTGQRENSSPTTSSSIVEPNDTQDAMVQECIEQMLQILENKSER